MKLGYLSSMDLATSAQPVALITVEERWRNAVEETNNRDPKGDNEPIGDNRGATNGKMYLRSLIQLGLMYPPFWFSMLESKKAMLILLEGNIEDHYLRRSCHIFQAVTHNFHTGFHGL